ncbi:MutS-related protein [Nannocystaceae bacterium ST9]
MANPDPRPIYAERLAQRSAVVERLDRGDRRLASSRFWIFVAFVVACVAGYRGWFSLWWISLPALVFLILVIVHDRLARARARAVRALEHYREGLDRLDDRWAGRGVLTLDHVPDDHPFAADLDLFGSGSLFDLLCRARTRAGEETLARWLSDEFGGAGVEPGVVDRLRARQASVRALIDSVDLREDLAVLGADVRVEVRPNTLIAWGRAPGPTPGLAKLWAIAGVLAPPFAIVGVLAWAWELGPWLLVGLAVFEGLVHRASKATLATIAGPLDRSAQELGVLAELLARVERERVDDPRLVELGSRLRGGSQAIARLRGLVGWYEAQRSGLFAPIAFLLSWAPSFALLIERWRAEHGSRIAEWFAALGEWEATCSLASHAFEHPDDPFPTLVDEAPCLIGDQLGHPLLPAGACVRNSLTLGRGEQPRTYVISGSNMSGKSTFLRTVGCNVVLGLAGGPVRAAALELSPVRLGATLRIQDSLHEGRSRFWAELVRLRVISELADRGPLLFLLDEIFHGTNSHDRRIGAEALLRSLIERGAIGLLTTHDLALAQAAESLAPRAANVHFQDELREGELVFDYRMRPGVVERSNALALMRAVGLDV